MLSGCAETGPTDVVWAFGLAIRGSTLYIGGSGSPAVRKCDIKEDGSLDACAPAGQIDTLTDRAQAIQFAGKTAYVLDNEAGKMYTCPALEEGSFSSCADAGSVSANNAWGFAITGTHAYVADSGTNTLIQCKLAMDGSITACGDAGVPVLRVPTQVVSRASSVYISNGGVEGGVTRCTVMSEGLLTGCSQISAAPKALNGIALR
jgi:hypothetical protein